MAILDLVFYPDPILSTPTQKVTQFDDALKKMVDDMWETHYAQKNCAALAANQLGLPWAITVIDFSEEKNNPLCLINPEIIEQSEQTTHTNEGCMSLPGKVHASVKRAATIRVQYQDLTGETHTLDADDFLSKCIQHEIDHLNGLTYLDRLPTLKRQMVERKYFQRIKKLKK